MDSHCHLNFDVYNEDRKKVLERAWSAGLVNLLTIGIDLETSKENYQLASTHKYINTAIGIHPNCSKEWQPHWLEALEVILEKDMKSSSNLVSAIGEIGLDYYRDHSPKQIQIKAFEAQLELASQANKPVVIHTRNTSNNDDSCIKDTLRILKAWSYNNGDQLLSEGNPTKRGVLHSFSGNINHGFEAIDIGMFLGISGPITFKNAKTLKDLVINIPLEYLLIETDSPFLTPHPYRGKRNEPANVAIIAEEIAKLKDISVEEVACKTTENAQSLFNWREH